MIDWEQIDTVLLDMDGTLLDLHFDNYFWQEYLPRYWGEVHSQDIETAKNTIMPRLKAMEGQLSWYCLDYWSRELDINILEIKNGIIDLITVRPTALEFLQSLDAIGKRPVMVTNAHQDLIELKLQRTGIGRYFDDIVCSHDLGVAKEELEFWSLLDQKSPYSGESTLLIDDNLHVLRTAREYGIGHLYSIARPDSRAPERDTQEFVPITDFSKLLPETIS